MRERRRGERHIISFPIRVTWKNSKGQQVIEEGLTENVGPRGALVYLPHHLPRVGNTVQLVVTEHKDDVAVTAEVLRVERNASHPQAALELKTSIRQWKEKVWMYAAKLIADQKSEEFEEW